MEHGFKTNPCLFRVQSVAKLRRVRHAQRALRVADYSVRRWSPRAAAGFGCAPFLGQRFEHFGRFIADNILPFRHRSDQASKDRLSAQTEISAAIVDADVGGILAGLLEWL